MSIEIIQIARRRGGGESCGAPRLYMYGRKRVNRGSSLSAPRRRRRSRADTIYRASCAHVLYSARARRLINNNSYARYNIISILYESANTHARIIHTHTHFSNRIIVRHEFLASALGVALLWLLLLLLLYIAIFIVPVFGHASTQRVQCTHYILYNIFTGARARTRV